MGGLLGWLPAALLAAGVPIFLVLLAASLVVLAFAPDLPLAAGPQNMFGALDKFALMAVPFFIFAGGLFSTGGISDRLIRWVEALFGGVRGSLGLTTIGTFEFFGAISGSSVAAVAAVGRTLYPALRAGGYDDKFSLGLITSGGAIASIIPPSILMIIYGAAAEQSVAKLFIAGFAPGLLIGLFTASYILWYSRSRTLAATHRFAWARVIRTTGDAVWALGAPVIILGSIYSGICTPTESAGIACVYGMLVARYVYRELSWKDIFDLAVSSTMLTAQIMVIVAAAGIYSWLLTVSGVPQALVSGMQALHLAPWQFLLAVNLLLLAVGCVIDGGSAILILAPLLVPLARAAGVDLIHFGIIVTVNLAIGMFTPPFGLNLFVSQAMFKAPMALIVRGLVPFLALQLTALGLITFVPEISLYLARFVK
ncbi:MAG TPA: TRAP transporter large permease [Burkholderiales bacterium]|nr:TRAP transporter large permease [Burkholderiales bacterium]